MNVHVSRRLKKELAWVIDKWLRVIDNKNVISNSHTTKKLKNKAVIILK